MEERKTAGQLSQELAQKTDKYEIRDLFAEKMKDISKKVDLCTEDGCKTYIGNFYVVIECKRERLMPNIDRSSIFHRVSCPAPHCDQIVFYYDKKEGSLTCLWALPEKSSVEKVVADPMAYYSVRPDMTKTVLDFVDGTLLKKAVSMALKDFNHFKETNG